MPHKIKLNPKPLSGPKQKMSSPVAPSTLAGKGSSQSDVMSGLKMLAIDQDGTQIIDSFTFGSGDSDPLQMENLSLRVKVSALPKCYTEGFYREVLLMRIADGEDQTQVLGAKAFLTNREPLSEEEMENFMNLLFAYPIFHLKHKDLYAELRRAAIYHHDRNPVEFRRSFAWKTRFLLEESLDSVMTKDRLLECTDLLEILDTLYTLRVWNKRVPMNCISYSEECFERVEQLMMEVDLTKYVQEDQHYAPIQLTQYVIRLRDN